MTKKHEDRFTKPNRMDESGMDESGMSESAKNNPMNDEITSGKKNFWQENNKNCFLARKFIYETNLNILKSKKNLKTKPQPCS